MSKEKKWTQDKVVALYNKPIMELLYESATIHRQHHDPNKIQVSTLVSIKQEAVPKIVPIALKPHALIQTLKRKT